MGNELELNKPVSYKLHVDEELLSITKQKLSLARYPEELDDVDENNWSQGAKVEKVKRLAEYWKDSFDWRLEEVETKHLPNDCIAQSDSFLFYMQAKINEEFEQYKVKVDVPDYGPQVLHYAHHPSTQINAIPLLFVHGWPGSFLEARKLLIPLTSPKSATEQAFHVIVPSIPGYGPGPAPTKSTCGPSIVARAFKVLMVDVLGYDRFVTQGGDWGGIITRSMAMQYPALVRACHHNFFPCGPPPFYKAPLTMGRLVLNSWLYTAREKAGLESIQYYMKEQSGYLKQQSTRPQTLGFALGDSPIGILGWLVEKFHEWVDTDHYDMPDNEVLTFVMMHWMQGVTPGIRFYKAAFAEQGPYSLDKAFKTYSATPVGLSTFLKEGVFPPLDWAKHVSNLQWHKDHLVGGHFASVEQPELLVSDLRQWFGSVIVNKAMEG